MKSILAAISLVATLTPSASGAISEGGGCRWETTVVAENAVETVRSVQVCSGTDPTSETGSAASDGFPPPRDSGLDTVCVNRAISIGIDPFEFCDIPPEEVEVADVTPDLVAAALRRVPVPGAEVVVQPPGGTTLVNFETNFYTDIQPLTHQLSLLGQRVELRLTPATYTWRFGDGAVQQGVSPGSAYPDLDVTHVYTSKQEAQPSVDTTWTATYRLNGGPSRPVPGDLTVAGAPVSLEVITARPRLVG